MNTNYSYTFYSIITKQLKSLKKTIYEEKCMQKKGCPNGQPYL